jgi:hypothetical protein
MDTIETLYGDGWMGGEETYGIKRAVTNPMAIQVITNGTAEVADWVDVRTP